MIAELHCQCDAFLAQYDPQHDRLIIKCRKCKTYREWDLAELKRQAKAGDVITIVVGSKPTFVQWVVSGDR